jgi:formylglycine-generating enzyme required for sulfatase activity
MKLYHVVVAACIGLVLGVIVFSKIPHGQPKIEPHEEEHDDVPKPPAPKPKPAETPSILDLVRIPGGRVPAQAGAAIVDVPPFWIDRTEVTNGQYETFLTECPPGSECGPDGLPGSWKEQAYQENQGDHPVVNVSWDDASAFCRWAKGRLPSAGEWARAATGDDQQIFPDDRTPDGSVRGTVHGKSPPGVSAIHDMPSTRALTGFSEWLATSVSGRPTPARSRPRHEWLPGARGTHISWMTAESRLIEIQRHKVIASASGAPPPLRLPPKAMCSVSPQSLTPHPC